MLTITAVLAMTTGCGGTSVKPEHREFQQLMLRPNINEAASLYGDIATQARNLLSKTFPELTWSTSDQVGRAGCNGEFDDVYAGDAETWGLPIWRGTASVANERWHQAIASITPLLQQHGFRPGFHVNGPKDYEIEFYDQYNATFSLGSMQLTTLDISTGCHLTTEAKRRGTPAIRPSY